MKLLLVLILSFILSLSSVEASLKIKYASCTGSCSCANKYINNYKAGSNEGFVIDTIPNFPEYKNYYSLFNTSWIGSREVLTFVDLDSNVGTRRSELAYPINVDDTGSLEEPNCAYVVSHKFKDGTCAYQIFCNADQNSGSSNNSSRLNINFLLYLSFFVFSAFLLF